MSKLTLNYKAIAKIMGIIILILGISMIIPWIYSEKTGDTDAVHAFRICCPASVSFGLLITLLIKSHKIKFRAREGYIVVASCWIVASVVGAFPYYIAGFADHYIDALFESTSGFTTTGCSVVAGKFLSGGLLLWKAISNWLGGMGILLFVISILPALGINGQIIAKAETPGPVLKKMTVRMSDSAKILYITYISFTILEIILLLLSGKVPLFDAVINTLGSISTGGVMVHPTGIAYYDSVYVEIVIGVFCILSSLNFVLYHYLITGKFAEFFNDIELRAFLIIMAVSIAVCTIALMTATGASFGTSLRDSFFQVVSMSTTSGYTRSPYMTWPSTCQIVLVVLMFIGGCASSTSGSLKVVRVLVMLKLIWRGCIKRIHPRSVVAVKLGKTAIPAPVVSGISAFIVTYMGIFLFSSFVLSFQGLGLDDTLTSALAMLSNTGTAFGETASLGNFSAFHPVLKLYMSCLMIIGRLELFTIIILFSKNFWGRDR